MRQPSADEGPEFDDSVFGEMFERAAAKNEFMAAANNNNYELEAIPEEGSSKERGSREQVMMRSNFLGAALLKGSEIRPVESNVNDEVAVKKSKSNTPKGAARKPSMIRGRSAEVIRVANILKNAL